MPERAVAKEISSLGNSIGAGSLAWQAPDYEMESYSENEEGQEEEDWSGRDGSKQRSMSFDLSQSSRSRREAAEKSVQTHAAMLAQVDCMVQTEAQEPSARPPLLSTPPGYQRRARSRSRSPSGLGQWFEEEPGRPRGREWDERSPVQRIRPRSSDASPADWENPEIPVAGPGSLDGLWVLEESVPKAANWLQCLKILGDEVTDALGEVHRLTWNHGVADLAGGATCRKGRQICRLGKSGSVQIFTHFELPQPPADPLPAIPPYPSPSPQKSRRARDVNGRGMVCPGLS